MKFLSLCSGIEAASVAWHPLNFECVGVAEIEPFPSAVLAHHYPGVPNFGDISRFEDWPEEMFAEIDIIVGGPPCQSFSIAGLRKGLNDDRGNLTLTYVRIIDHADRLRLRAGKPPVICVYENVPGLLSDRTNAFGSLLGGLAGEDVQLEPSGKRWTDAGCVFGPQRAIAWRIQDAQYHGLAQRRRRVFVVASARDGFDPAAVLLEFEGVRRDTPPRREAGKVAPTIPSRSTAGGGLGTDFDLDGGVIRHTEELADTLAVGANQTTGFNSPSVVAMEDPVPPLMARSSRGGAQTLSPGYQTDGHMVAVASTGDISHCLNAGGMGRQDYETETLVAHTLQTQCGQATEDGTGRGAPLVPVACNNTGQGWWTESDVAATVRAGDDNGGGGARESTVVAFSYKDSGNDATVECSPTLRSLGAYDANGGGQMAVTYPINTQIALRHQALGERTGMGIGSETDPGFTLQAGHSHAVAHTVAFHPTQDPISSTDGSTHALGCGSKGGQASVAIAWDEELNAREEQAGTLSRGGDGGRHDGVMSNMAVRRLTPRECEALQGFPPDYTLIPWKKKPAADCPDGPRYKALGNSMAVPVMSWIGARIARHLRGEL